MTNSFLKRTTQLVMHVTMGHTYLMQHDLKPNSSREMEMGNCHNIKDLPETA